ncbi:ABC transporter ATP-binding protein [Paenibacillus silviterrae]|uniref:ABC transporter ATP-binding protein n=1 Tax=Paenibacillus silviterrae TaxID=3242194 RepID=UPI0025428C83|nr:ABC transporter ATP-binding protein [Paenibacillus chinjuensis]
MREIPMGPGGRPGFGHGSMGMPKARPKNTKETLAKLWSYLRSESGSLFLVILLTSVHAGLSLIGPFLIGVAIDDYILPQRYAGLLQLCAILLGVYICGAALAWLQAFTAAKLSQRTVRAMRGDVFGKLQGLPLRFFDTQPHGDLMSRATNDIESIATTLHQSLIQLISSVITVAGCLVIMLSLDVRLTLLSLVTIPLVAILTRVVSGHTRKQFAAQQKQLGELNGFIEETVSGQKVVATFCREPRALADFSRLNTKLADVGIRAQILTGLMGPFMNVINNLGFAAIALGGGWMALMQWTTVGVVVSFLNYSRQLGRPVNELANQFNMIQAAIAGAERVFELMEQKSEHEEAARRTVSSSFADMKGEVIFNDVSFGYKEGVHVLQNVSLHASPGSMIALVGPTGAGKTTIVNLLTRFYETTSGSITIDGADIKHMDKEALRRQLGIVLQDAYVFSDTIRENIRYGRLDATDAEVEAATKLANADSFIRKLPQGYDTVLSKEGTNVSHGQRQLLTIARAILANPAVLILDEATSSIDTRTEMHIQEAMRVLMQGRTSFVIAHRLSTIREADMILVIDGGRIIERGTHEELLDSKGFYYRLYTTQFEKAG